MPRRRASSEGSSGGREESGQRKGLDGRALGGREESLLVEMGRVSWLLGPSAGFEGEAGLEMVEESGLKSVACEALWVSLEGSVDEVGSRLAVLRWWTPGLEWSLARWRVL